MSENLRTKAPISQMRVPELRAYAEQLGLDVDPKARKAELLAAIRQIVPARRGRPAKDSRPPQLSMPEASISAEGSAEEKKEDSSEASSRDANGAIPPIGRAPRRNSRTQNRSGRGGSRQRGGRSAAQREGDEELNVQESTERSSRRSDSGERAEHEDGGRQRRRQRNRRGSEHDAERNRSAHIELDLPRPKNAASAAPAEQKADMSAEDRMAALDAIGDAAERRAETEGEGYRRRRSRNRNGEGSSARAQRTNESSQTGDSAQSAQSAPAAAGQTEETVVPVAGIVDQVGNQFFLRTGGYLPGPNDAQISSAMVRQYGLRRGDAVQGTVRPEEEGGSDNRTSHRRNNNNRNRNGRRRYNNQKTAANQLVEIKTINGLEPEVSARRPEFNKLTPLYPNEMLRMETSKKAISARAIDLLAPVGKGQRGLIVSPPKAGKTMILQTLAQSIAHNDPSVHLMVVLVDERPEEVTDMRGIVKGEVIASTFDRPASDHTTVAELAIERAKRLVELGQDVVVLLDSLTRLARAYNLAAPTSGRILSGGVDAAALYPPKKFFGAARNIRNGGSLTIIATALVETGSKMDEVIFEEFKGTGNMELRLSRQLADRRIFPAIDVNASGTRREEMLYTKEELQVLWSLRRALGTLSVEDASDFVLKRLKNTENNAEFLVSIMRSVQASGRAALAD